MSEQLKRKGPTAIEVLQEMARRPNYTPTVQVEAWRTADGMVYLPYKKHAIATAFAELIGRPDGGIPPDKIEVIERIGFVVEEPSGAVIPHQPRTANEHQEQAEPQMEVTVKTEGAGGWGAAPVQRYPGWGGGSTHTKGGGDGPPTRQAYKVHIEPPAGGAGAAPLPFREGGEAPPTFSEPGGYPLGYFPKMEPNTGGGAPTLPFGSTRSRCPHNWLGGGSDTFQSVHCTNCGAAHHDNHFTQHQVAKVSE